jgi:CDP-diacylglycerol--glycerol-3-phosphate 3-phosphatidyltransferase
MLVVIIVAMIIIMKGAGMIVGYIRYKQLMMMHTYASKTGAMVCFLFPLVLIATGLNENVLVIFLAAYVYLFLLEEILINMVMPEPRRDIKGLYQAIQIRRQFKAEK